jgi:hypothetical protein
MNITEDARKAITDEITYVLAMMEKSDSLEKRLYYFSAIYGITQRMFNFEPDEDLICMHTVLNQVYGLLKNRVEAVKKGDLSVPISDQQIDKLMKLTKDLGKRIKSKEGIDDILKKFIVLSYSTTGNGYYLLEKGLLKV